MSMEGEIYLCSFNRGHGTWKKYEENTIILHHITFQLGGEIVQKIVGMTIYQNYFWPTIIWWYTVFASPDISIR